MAEQPVPTPASGWVTFAGWMLLLAGLWQGFIGFLGVLSDEFFVVGQNYVLRLDVTTWGWIHMVIGVLLFVVGCFVFVGKSWANIVGILAAAVSALSLFAWLPWYPLFAISVIVVDVLIIFGLAAHDGEVGTKG